MSVLLPYLRVHFVPAVGIIGDFHAVEGRDFDSIEIQFVRFQRNLSAPLTVHYGVGWTAGGNVLSPADFQDNAAALGSSVPSSVVIGANSDKSDVIALVAVDDTIDSQTEQVTVSVYPSTDSYIACKYDTTSEDRKKLDIDAFNQVTLQVVEGVVTFAPDDHTDPNSPLVASNDMRQGAVGDCYFLAAAMALADSDPDYIRTSLISDRLDEQGGLVGWSVYLYEILPGPNGTLDLTGQRKEVVIEGEILSEGLDMAQLNGDVDSAGRVEVWPIVLERAWSRHLAGPPQVGDIDEGGHASVAWYGLTGETPQAANHYNAIGKSQAEIVAELSRMYDTQGQIVINTQPNPPGLDYITLPSGGNVVGGHSYTASISWDTDPVTGDRVLVKVELNNPWGEDYASELFPGDLTVAISSIDLLPSS